MEDPPEVFVYPPAEELKCPICFDLLRDPVITAECAHTFCRICFKRCAETKANCPTCRSSITTNHINPNRIVAGILDNIQIHCRFGLKKLNNGEWEVDDSQCPVIVKRSERRSHETNCPYRPQRCMHVKRGCIFQGTAQEVDEHIKKCSYEQLKPYLEKNEEEIELLKQRVKSQDLELEQLKKKLTQILGALNEIKMDQASQQKLDEMLVNNNKKRKDHDNNGSANGAKRKSSLTLKDVFNKEKVQCTKTLTAHDDTVEALVVDEQQNLLYSASWDHTIKIWDLDSFICRQTLKSDSDVRELVIHDDKLFSGCGNGAVQVWDIAQLKCVKSAKKHSDDVLALKLSNDRLYSGSSDATVRVWDVNTLECVDTWLGHNNWVFALEVDPRNGLVFSGSSDNSVKIWSTQTNRCTATLNGHSDQVRALAVSGNQLFTGSYDCTIKVWDIRTLQCMTTLNVFNEVFGLATSDDFVFSGDENGTLKIWDIESRKCLHTLSEHSGSVYAFAVTNDKLLSASSDTTIKVWQ